MQYDAIIIGSGAGGGTLANSLANAGKRILILERGDFLPREKQNWSPEAVFVGGRYISRDRWYDGDGSLFQPQSHYFVGGATKMYGAALMRLRPQDFHVMPHQDGMSPAWPIDYAELEPWYTRAEWLYQVHGNANGQDPTEGPHSRPYPWPGVSHEPRIAQLAADLERAGYHPFTAPSGVLLDEANPSKSACIRCNTCDGFPCLVHAKSDAEVIAIRPIMDLPNVTLVTGAEVIRLVTNAAGTEVTGVMAKRPDGSRELYHGHIVVLAAGAANSAALLLRSANDAHPAGLANGSGQVGRNYMMHNSRAVIALDREPNHTTFQKTLGLNDFYLAQGTTPDRWPLGNIQMVGKSNAAAMRGESPLARLAPDMALSEVAAHAVDFWLTTEDLPRPGNRVTLAADGRIQLAYAATNQHEADGLYLELQRMLNHLGMRRHVVLPRHHLYMSKGMPVAAVAHQAGTCRFGTDPDGCVLDVNCKAHELGNLYVTDASFMPSVGAVNPALTIMANALRVGDHIARELEGR